MKLIDRQDLTWTGLALSLFLLFIVSSAFKGDLPGGAFAERMPVLMNYLGGFLANLLVAVIIIGLIAVIKRVRGAAYTTFRRDFALAVLFMCVVTFKPARAVEPVSHGADWSISLVDSKLKNG